MIFSYSKMLSQGIPNTESKFTKVTDSEGTIFYYQNDKIIFEISYNSVSFNYNNIKSLGIISPLRSTWSLRDNELVDSLYHYCNPPKFYLKSGKLRKGFWNELVRRLKSRTHSGGYGTHLYLQEAVKILQTQYPDYSLETVKNYINNLTSCNVVLLCPISNTIVSGVNTQHARIRSTSYSRISAFIRLEDFGFHLDGMLDIWITDNDIIYAGKAYDKNKFTLETCPSCGRTVPSESMNVEEGECNTCVANKYKIHNYSTKVPQLLSFKNEYKNAKNPVYFGCELEFETLDRDKAKIEVGKRISGYAIMKNDSSINNGFEVVTCPATFGIHMKAMEHLFTNLSNNVYAQSNTGMHVHISKKPLSVLTIGKITEFLNRESNKDFIKSVAGRISSYAQIDPYKTVTYPFVMGAGHRYSAVNLNNSDTIEIRIFATPENFYQFAYRFEFCKALVDYCMPAGVSVKSLKDLTHFETFTNWVKQNRPFYPNLYKFVQQGVTI